MIGIDFLPNGKAGALPGRRPSAHSEGVCGLLSSLTQKPSISLPGGTRGLSPRRRLRRARGEVPRRLYPFLQQKYREAVQPLRKVLEGYAKDRKIIKKSVFSEDDVLPAPGKPFSPLERAGLKSMLLLYWIAQHLGGYPAKIPPEFHVREGGASTPALPSEAGRRPGCLGGLRQRREH